METIFILIGFFFLISPILAIIALSKVNGLKNEVERLRLDVNALRYSKKAEPQPHSQARAKANETIKPNTAQRSAPIVERDAALRAPTKRVTAGQGENSTVTSSPAPTQRLKRERVEGLKPKPKTSLEEKIGSQWSVWIGGIALAIGAIFLLRFSIEAGVFTPAMRIGLASVLGLCALLGGEWMRRRDLDNLSAVSNGNTLIQNAYIPGVLTAVGIFTWLGAAYVSYAVYGFLGPTVAFMLLGLTSLLGLALGLLHGPKLAALGLVAAFVTPLLVSTSSPNYIALYGYLLLIAGAALALAHKRRWPDITTLTLFGLLGWSFLTANAIISGNTIFLWAGFSAISYGVGSWAAQEVERKAPESDMPRELLTPYLGVSFNSIAFTVWTAILALIIFGRILQLTPPYAPAVWMALLFSALFIMNAGRGRPIAVHLVIGGALATLTLLIGDLRLGLTLLIMAVFMLSVWALCFRESRRPKAQTSISFDPMVWTLVSAGLPLSGWLMLLLSKHEGFATKTSWLSISKIGAFEGLIYLGISLTFAATAEYLWRKNERKTWPINIYAFASGIAILCGLLLCLNVNVKFYATLLTALLGMGAYWVRPLFALRIMIAGALALATFFAVFHHIQGNDVGTRYVINALWIYLALPAVMSFTAARLLERHSSDIWSEGLKAISLALGALFTVMQIHHLMNDGQVLATNLSLEEAALFVLTGLCFTFGGSWLERGVTTPLKARQPHKQLMPILSMALSVLTLAVFAIAVCLSMNPLFNSNHLVKGNVVLNSLVLSYGAPALLLSAIILWTRGSRPEGYIRFLSGLGLISFMLFVTSMVRFLFSGAEISIFTYPPDGMELYAISAVWLMTGIALLILGLKREHRELRLVSGVIIILTILKAFLIDMANLEGVLRAMSFVILGLVLIVIGRIYQKLIFTHAPSSKEVREDKPA